MWQVQQTDEFGQWWGSLTDEEQDEIDAAVELLEERGPALGRPLVETIKQSKFSNMKELRVGTTRILFAFDPLRVAILLIGGDKKNKWKKWYDTYVPVADKLYETHLAEIKATTERRE